jgi:hypothetical protein
LKNLGASIINFAMESFGREAQSDVVIPATEIPAGKEAQVNRYLALRLSVQPGEFHRQFVELDGERTSTGISKAKVSRGACPFLTPKGDRRCI